MMTEEEEREAGAALVDWFISQKISPSDGVMVMIGVIGGFMQVMSRTNPKAVEEAFDQMLGIMKKLSHRE